MPGACNYDNTKEQLLINISACNIQIDESFTLVCSRAMLILREVRDRLKRKGYTESDIIPKGPHTIVIKNVTENGADGSYILAHVLRDFSLLFDLNDSPKENVANRPVAIAPAASAAITGNPHQETTATETPTPQAPAFKPAAADTATNKVVNEQAKQDADQVNQRELSLKDFDSQYNELKDKIDELNAKSHGALACLGNDKAAYHAGKDLLDALEKHRNDFVKKDRSMSVQKFKDECIKSINKALNSELAQQPVLRKFLTAFLNSFSCLILLPVWNRLATNSTTKSWLFFTNPETEAAKIVNSMKEKVNGLKQ